MPNNRYQCGVTYLALLFLVALMGVVLGATGIVWKTAQQREKERELLFIGDQFRKAILLYYEKTPGAKKQYPKSLNDLLKDDRFASPQRHLRKIYFDPMTRKTEWGLAVAPDGGIMGVYSLSNEPPIKTGNFSLANQSFEGKTKYSEWQFIHQATQTGAGVPSSQPRLFIVPSNVNPAK
jgi:type II secretory pathway pseudopilin PulG